MKKSLVAILLLSIVVPSLFVRAQSTDAPLILLMKGDFWALNEGDTTPKRLTEWGCNQSPALSPDGKQIAYVTLPKSNPDGEGGGCDKYGGGTSPTDIRVLDISTAESLVIAEQAPEYFTKEYPDSWDIRSAPAWSPDGTKLAWINLPTSSSDNQNQLVIYDFASNHPRTVEIDVPGYCVFGGIGLPELQWGNIGIVVYSQSCTFARNMQAHDLEATFYLYDQNGELISKLPLVQPPFERWVNFGGLLTGQDHDQGILYPRTGGSVLFDLQTGLVLPLDGTLEQYSLSADQSLSISTIYPDDSSLGEHAIFDSDGKPIEVTDLTTNDSLAGVTLSPDGQGIAFATGDRGTLDNRIIHIWRNGQINTTFPTDDFFLSFLWGPTAWRIHPNPPAQAVENFDCPGTLKPRLTVGGQGVVLPNKANNLRETASLTANLVGQVPAGETFLVGNGPVCSEGQVWWEVYYKNFFGWTVESQGRYYYLEPVS